MNHQLDNKMAKTPLSSCIKKALFGGVALAMAMGISPAMAGNGNDDFETVTPFNRIARLPVVKDANGQVDHVATYAKGKAAALALANYVALNKDAIVLGDNVIKGVDWVLGGTSATCRSTQTCTATEISKAIIEIPSPEPINPNDPTYLSTGVVTEANTKKASVLDFCNEHYAKMALGVSDIVPGKKVVNGYSHTPALPCEVSVWNDDEHIYVDMLDPNAIFSLFFTDVLFSADMQDPAFAEAISNLPEWPQHELLAHEKELLGFYVTGHPLTPYAPILEKYALANTAKLPELPNRSLTRIGGLIAAVQNGMSKKSGKPYSIITLEDLEGSVQVLCMNENYDKYRELLVTNKAILVIGEVNNGEDKPKIFPQEIMPLEEAPKKYTKQVHLRLHTAHLKPDDIEAVRELVAAHPGKCPLFLCFMRPTGEVIFLQPHERFGVLPSLALQQAADARFGEETYYVKVDTSLPEKQQRRWERKPGANDDE